MVTYRLGQVFVNPCLEYCETSGASGSASGTGEIGEI